MEAPMMQIGGVAKETMDIAAEAIIKVATCSPIPDIAIKALEVLQHLGTVNNMTVSNCTFTGGDPAIKVAQRPVVGSDYEFEKDDKRYSDFED